MRNRRQQQRETGIKTYTQMRNRRQQKRDRDGNKDIHADEKQKTASAAERDRNKDIHADEKQKAAEERQGRGQRHTCR